MKINCEKCKKEFTYKKLLKSAFKSSGAIIVCEKCKEEYMVKGGVKMIINLIAFLPILRINFSDFKINKENLIAIGVFLAWYFIVSSLGVMFYKLKKVYK